MKKVLIGLSALVLGFSLVSCKQSQTTTDTSSLETEVAKKWLKLGSTDTVSSVYTNQIYKPESTTKANYYTLYAPTDIAGSVRVVVNTLESNYFESSTTVKLRYLSTSALTDTTYQSVATNISSYKENIKTAITDFEAKVQESYSQTLGDLGYTEYNQTNNRLCVFYMPCLLRAYNKASEEGKDGEITLTTFVLVPVYHTLSGLNGDQYTNELVQGYVTNSKLVSFTYKDSKIS